MGVAPTSELAFFLRCVQRRCAWRWESNLRAQPRQRLQRFMIGGVVDLATEVQTGIPTLKVRVDPAAAARQGWRPAPSRKRSRRRASPMRSARLSKDRSRSRTAFLIRSMTQRRSIRSRTRIQTPDRRQIPLSTVAAIQEDRGPNFVVRENVQRRFGRPVVAGESRGTG